MIDGTYQVEVDTPLGRKSGTVKLTTKGNEVEVAVKIPIIGSRVARGTVEGNKFSVSGSLWTLITGKADYDIEGEVRDDLLTAILKSKGAEFIIAGARI